MGQSGYVQSGLIPRPTVRTAAPVDMYGTRGCFRPEKLHWSNGGYYGPPMKQYTQQPYNEVDFQTLFVSFEDDHDS